MSAQSEAAAPGRARMLRRLQNYVVFLVLLGICLFLALATDPFATADNLANVSEQVSVVGIIAMGMTMLLVSGNLDLSIGGMVAVIGVIAANLMNEGGIALGIAGALVAGLILGAVNGLIVTRLKVNSLVATLGSGLAYGGIAFLLSGSQPIVLDDRSLQTLMSTRYGGVPIPSFVFLVVIVAATWFLHLTVGGRQLFAVGANPEASRYAGIRIDRVRFIPFVVTGLLCSLASLILTGLLNTADPAAGGKLPLQVIAAVVVGGVSIAGGRGSIFMAVVGVVLIGVVANGFNLLDLDPNYQNIFTGAIIVVAVAVDSLIRKRAAEATARSRAAAETDPAAPPEPSRPEPQRPTMTVPPR
jgi:ribose/xylose/arabinose/galactoside ABC-type transport system permease subunit